MTTIEIKPRTDSVRYDSERGHIIERLRNGEARPLYSKKMINARNMAAMLNVEQENVLQIALMHIISGIATLPARDILRHVRANREQYAKDIDTAVSAISKARAADRRHILATIRGEPTNAERVETFEWLMFGVRVYLWQIMQKAAREANISASPIDLMLAAFHYYTFDIREILDRS